MATIEVSASNWLALSQPVTSNMLGASASNTLALTHKAKTQFSTEGAKNTLQLAQKAEYHFTIKNVNVNHFLELHHKGAKSAGVLHVLSNFAMWDRAKPVKTEHVTHSLVFRQTAIAVRTKLATNSLTLTDQASINVIRNRSIIQTLGLHQGATARKSDKYAILSTIPTMHGPNAPEC